MKLTYGRACDYLKFEIDQKSQFILNQSDIFYSAKFIFLFFLASAAGFSQVHAQSPNVPTASNESWFDEIIGIENSGIINGPEYKMEVMGASSNPFFVSAEVKGMVRYNQQVFYAPLVYDIYKDEIIVKHIGASGRAWLVKLEKKLVQEFVISGRLFRNFDRGFHEVLFESTDFSLISKRSKEPYLRNRITNYIEIDRFYIIESGQWTPLRTKQGFMNMLTSKEDKKQLKLFLNQHRIKVRKFRDEDLIKVATFINALRNKKQQ